MLTIQSYQPVKYRPNFKCKSSTSNVSELSQSSKKLLDDVRNLIKSESKKMSQSEPMRSRRFADGSFVELQTGGEQKLNIKYLRMNQRPIELSISQNGAIEYKNKSTTDLNSLIERYIPDIIEREQIKYIF